MQFNTEGDVLALFQQATWMKRVALRLLGDGHHADDAVQEALIAALEKAPNDTEGLRRWLAVALNLRIRRRWAIRDRGTIGLKADVDASDVELSPVDSLMKAEAMEAMLQGLFNLADPYRTAVSLYFLEGKTAAEVGKLTGVPEPTVRTRIKRGLEALRASLEKRYGDLWPNGCLALLGFHFRPGIILPPSPQGRPSADTFSRRWAPVFRSALLVLGGAAVVATLFLALPRDPDPHFRDSDTQADARPGVSTEDQSPLITGRTGAPPELVETAAPPAGGLSREEHAEVVRLALRAATPEGTPLLEALPHGSHFLGGLGLSSPWLPALPAFDALPRGLGAGLYRQAIPPVRAEDEAAGGSCLLGFLDVDPQRLPAMVALAYRQVVLQTQPVLAGAHEVFFQVDPAAIQHLLGRVSIEVVDGVPGLDPVRPQVFGGAGRELLWAAEQIGASRWSFAEIPPGWFFLQIRARQRATTSRLVLCPQGAALDLGTVTLRQAIPRQCRVLLPSGEPGAGAETLVVDASFPHWRLGVPYPQVFRVGNEGMFLLETLGEGPAQLQARLNVEGRWLVSRPQRILPGDARSELTLQLEESVMGVLAPRLGEFDQILFLLEDSLGAVTWAQWMTHASRGEIWAPPGSYVLRGFSLEDEEVYRQDVAFVDIQQVVAMDPAVRTR